MDRIADLYIIRVLKFNVRGSSNGRTMDFDSINRGSNPCPRV